MRWTGEVTIEVSYPYGTRQVTVRRPLWEAVSAAEDIWEDEAEQVRVRVLRKLENGRVVCICHFPPVA